MDELYIVKALNLDIYMLIDEESCNVLCTCTKQECEGMKERLISAQEASIRG